MNSGLDDLDHLTPANLEDLSRAQEHTEDENEALCNTEDNVNAKSTATTNRKQWVFVDTPVTKARRENIQRFMLDNKLKSQRLIQILGGTDSSISQMISENPTRPVSGKKAQIFEKHFGMLAGHIDAPNAVMPTLTKPADLIGTYVQPREPVQMTSGIDTFPSNINLWSNVLTLVMEKTHGLSVPPQTIAKITSLIVADATDNGGQVRDKLLTHVISLFAD